MPLGAMEPTLPGLSPWGRQAGLTLPIPPLLPLGRVSCGDANPCCGLQCREEEEGLGKRRLISDICGERATLKETKGRRTLDSQALPHPAQRYVPQARSRGWTLARVGRAASLRPPRTGAEGAPQGKRLRQPVPGSSPSGAVGPRGQLPHGKSSGLLGAPSQHWQNLVCSMAEGCRLRDRTEQNGPLAGWEAAEEVARRARPLMGSCAPLPAPLRTGWGQAVSSWAMASSDSPQAKSGPRQPGSGPQTKKSTEVPQL